MTIEILRGIWWCYLAQGVLFMTKCLCISRLLGWIQQLVGKSDYLKKGNKICCKKICLNICYEDLAGSISVQWLSSSHLWVCWLSSSLYIAYPLTSAKKNYQKLEECFVFLSFFCYSSSCQYLHHLECRQLKWYKSRELTSKSEISKLSWCQK